MTDLCHLLSIFSEQTITQTKQNQQKKEMSPSLMDTKKTQNHKQKLKNSALCITFNRVGEIHSQYTEYIELKYLCDTKPTVRQILSLTGAFPVFHLTRYLGSLGFHSALDG